MFARKNNRTNNTDTSFLSLKGLTPHTFSHTPLKATFAQQLILDKILVKI